LPVDFGAYAEVSAQIKSILHEFSPVCEDSGLDEAFLDVSNSEEPSERIGRAIKQRIRTATGLACSVGIGPNKLLAKLASDMEKPDGLTVLTEPDIQSRIWPLPVRKLLGVGPKTEARLAALGVKTIGALAAIPLSQLQLHFGDAHGRYLHDAARGIDESPLITTWEPRSVGRQVTFQKDISGSRVIAKALNDIVEAAVADAREQGFRARTVAVRLRFADFETLTRQMTLPRPSIAALTIKRAARHCLERITLAKKVRLIGVRLSGLISPNQ
jgi:DNA polymerase-4